MLLIKRKCKEWAEHARKRNFLFLSRVKFRRYIFSSNIVTLGQPQIGVHDLFTQEREGEKGQPHDVEWLLRSLFRKPEEIFGESSGNLSAINVSSCSLRDHQCGCRGGNRYVEGDLLTFGYLMLDDSLGFHYYRLISVEWFPGIPLLSAN